MHYKYILFLILAKPLCLLRDINQFYDEGYVKFSVSEKVKSLVFLIYCNFV